MRRDCFYNFDKIKTNQHKKPLKSYAPRLDFGALFVYSGTLLVQCWSLWVPFWFNVGRLWHLCESVLIYVRQPPFLRQPNLKKRNDSSKATWIVGPTPFLMLSLVVAQRQQPKNSSSSIENDHALEDLQPKKNTQQHENASISHWIELNIKRSMTPAQDSKQLDVFFLPRRPTSQTAREHSSEMAT